ncbi:MAG: hypothetical protein LAT58_12555, partial [Opitutales bacterium]|nr:hypothetical protein [Opitutales bacterium]
SGWRKRQELAAVQGAYGTRAGRLMVCRTDPSDGGAVLGLRQPAGAFCEASPAGRTCKVRYRRRRQRLEKAAFIGCGAGI